MDTRNNRFLEIEPFDFDLEMHTNVKIEARQAWLWNIIHNEWTTSLGRKLLGGKAYLRSKKVVTRWFSKPKKKLDLDLREETMKKVFMDDIKQLEDLLGRDFDVWKS